jgi:hypothetical protein
MLANNTTLVQMVRPVMEEMLASDRGDQFRRDLSAKGPGAVLHFHVNQHAAWRHTGHRVPGLVGTTAVGLDRGRQRHEDPVLADLVDQACGLERVPQILLHPRHREHDSAAG